MKANKLMIAAMMLGAIAFVSCDKKEKEPEIVVPGTGGNGGQTVTTPEVAPTDGAVTLVVKFDVAPCDGYDIVFCGAYKDHNWGNEGDGEKFVKLADGFYSVVLVPGEDGTISGRPCQANASTDGWPGYDWSHDIEDLINLSGLEEGIATANEYSQINLTFTEDYLGQVIFVESKKWNTTPCSAASTYNVTVKTPAFCKDFEIELVGSFEGWGTSPVALTKSADNVFTASISATEGAEIKVREKGTWDNEVTFVELNENGEIAGAPNFVLGTDLNVVLDYSDAATYVWKVCHD